MEPSRSSQGRQLDTASEAAGLPTPPAAPRLRIVPSGSDGESPELTGALPHDLVPDDALIAALVAGETEALGALYDRHGTVVFSLLVRIAGDRETAEELLQEVFLRAWQHASTFDDTLGTVRGWLHSIAHHLALNELRRQRRRPQLHDRASSVDADGADYTACIDDGPAPEVVAWCADRAARLAQALDQLPPTQRAVLVLFAAGYSQSEIAAKLGEPLGTVKSRMRRALCYLRVELPALGIDASWRID